MACCYCGEKWGNVEGGEFVTTHRASEVTQPGHRASSQLAAGKPLIAPVRSKPPADLAAFLPQSYEAAGHSAFAGLPIYYAQLPVRSNASTQFLSQTNLCLPLLPGCLPRFNFHLFLRPLVCVSIATKTNLRHPLTTLSRPLAVLIPHWTTRTSLRHASEASPKSLQGPDSPAA